MIIFCIINYYLFFIIHVYANFCICKVYYIISITIFLCNKMINFLLLLIAFTVTTLWVSCHALKFLTKPHPCTCVVIVCHMTQDPLLYNDTVE